MTIRAGYYSGPDALARAVGRGSSAARAEDDASAFEPTHATPSIALDGDEWTVRVDGETLTASDRDLAFALIEGSEWFRDCVAAKHPDKWHALAVGRWVDAASVEDIPAAHDGSQIKAEFIDQIIGNLTAARTAPPVDGGGISDPHETVYAPDAAAAGRVFAGVRVEGEDGRPHLWLWVRLDVKVDAEVDAQQWAFGSIAFVSSSEDRYTGQPIGARLISYALTNFPFVDALEPHQPRAERSQPRNRAGETLAVTRSRKNYMPNTTDSTVAARGPAADMLADLAAMLGISAEDAAGEGAMEKMKEAIAALQKLAAEEADAPAARAVMGLDGEALEMFTADVVTSLRDVFGQPDAEPAALLDMLKSSADAFKGALGGAAPADDAGEGGQRQADDAGTAARAEVVGMRAQLDAMRTELAALRGRERSREINDHVDASFRAAKLSPPQGDDRKELLALCDGAGDDWKRIVTFALRSVNVPPAGTVLADESNAQPVAVNGGVGGSAEEEFDRAIEVARAELKRENPSISKRELRAKSYEMARARTAKRQ
jgi:hypothetical protein